MHEWLDMHVFTAITVEPQTSQLHLTVLSKLGGSMTTQYFFEYRSQAEVGLITGEVITVSLSIYK